MANIKFSALPASGTITGAETTVGLQSGAAVLFSPYTTQAVGDASLNLATMQALAEGLQYVNPASAVDEATAAVLPNTPTYSNGTAGVGATLTSATNTVLVVDGITVALNDRVLVKNQASTFQNGVYTQTQVGTGSVPWILTRATDYDTPTNINLTGTVPVIAGTANALTNWLLVSTITAIGSPNAITYVQQTTGGSSGGGGSSNVKGKPPFTKNAVMIGQGGNSLTSIASAGASGQFLQSQGSGSPPVMAAVVASVNTQTSSYQLVLADANNIVAMQVTGAGTLTIPANASVAFPVGTIVDVLNIGTANLTIAITTDTLNLGSGGALVSGSITLPVGATVSLLKVASTTWLATGNNGTPTRVFVGSYTVSGSSTATISSSSLTGGVGIPGAGYNNLIIRAHLKTAGTDNGGLGWVNLQLNGDTTTGHYTGGYYGAFQGTGVVSAGLTPAATGVQIVTPNNSYNSDPAWGCADIIIHNYNQTAIPIAVQSQYYNGTTTGSAPRVGSNGFNYTPSAVITSLTLSAFLVNGSTASDFVAGTFIEVYAEK